MKQCIIILALLYCSCSSKTSHNQLTQDELFKKEGTDILDEIRGMIKSDQDIRNYELYWTTDTNKIDSIVNSKNIDGMEMSFMVQNDEDTSTTSNRLKDSIWTVMDALQTKHTKRMVEIISKYGYPSSERIGDSGSKINPAILLHHADIKYKDTLLTLLHRELALGRVDTNTVEMAKWDMDGRNDMPNLDGVTIIKINSKTGKADTLQK